MKRLLRWAYYIFFFFFFFFLFFFYHPQFFCEAIRLHQSRQAWFVALLLFPFLRPSRTFPPPPPLSAFSFRSLRVYVSVPPLYENNKFPKALSRTEEKKKKGHVKAREFYSRWKEGEIGSREKICYGRC